MRKKLLSIIFACVVAFVGLTPCFSLLSLKAIEQKFASGSGIEDSFFNETSKDLIPTNITTTLANAKTENNVAPYNLETKTRYDGSVVTPNAGEYGEFKNRSFGILGGYSPKVDDAIFLWVYLLDKFSYTLRISISNGADMLSWEFSHQQITIMGDGWKLLQLNLRDHEFSSEDYMTKTYSTIIFSYCSEAEFEETEETEFYEGIESKTNERFSFYHVFASEDVSNEHSSGMIYNLPKTYYEYKENFNFNSTVFIGDSILLKNAKEIFDVLYVGKYDLSNYTTESKYYWTVSITSPSSVTTKIEFGNYINFYEEGYYYLTIQLHQQGEGVILNDDISIFCEELTLGRFMMGTSYKIKDNEKILISFNLADGIVFDDYSVLINNNKAKIYSNYQEGNVVYICVAGVSSGAANLEITAKARSKNGVKSKSITSSATITIEENEKSMSLEILILWIVLAVLCTIFMVYMAISVVKSRKNDVK